MSSEHQNGVVTDNQARTEQEILASELSYRRLFEAAQDGILILDVDTGRVDDVNPFLSWLLGFSREEMIGKTVGELSPFKDIESNQAMLERLQEQGYVRYENLPLESRDGRKMAVEFVSNVYQAGDKKVIQCNVRDITERKKVEAELRRAQRLESVGTLAGGIAHDLNNILSPIMMSIDILKNLSDNPQAQKILKTLEVNAQRGADIVEQILSLAGGLEGEDVEAHPKHLLQNLERIIKKTFPNDTKLQFSVPDDTWTIMEDSTQVRPILLNLCVNARDAGPCGSNLNISVENYELDEQHSTMRIQAKVGHYVVINITDSKTGVPQDIHDKIFDPFFANPEAANGSAKAVALPPGNGEMILVVDDEASILTMTSQTLQAFGYRALTAKDGADAVATYAQHHNDIAIVLTDMMMPIMDGLAMMKILKRINPAVKIVGSSGLHANSNIAKAGGIKHFLPKPYSPETLLKTMRTILNEV
ncbi:PAS domain S-box protein [Methylacidiphilales bacterium]|nr:PAS domain S-box protein [Candidatus Methylacidiphilales bacterium]